VSDSKSQRLGAELKTLNESKLPPEGKKVIVQFPPILLDRTDQACIDLDIDRSKLIREAVEYFLDKKDQEQLEKAYTENSKVALKISEAFLSKK
jgi:hypothetical protein